MCVRVRIACPYSGWWHHIQTDPDPGPDPDPNPNPNPSPHSGWWHHVQTCSTPCVSMAWWFWERTKQQADAAAAANEAPALTHAIDPRAFGIARRAHGLLLARWLEDSLGKLIANGDELEGLEVGSWEAARAGVVCGGPQKSASLLRCLRRLGWLAEARLRKRGRPVHAELDGVTALACLHHPPLEAHGFSRRCTALAPTSICLSAPLRRLSARQHSAPAHTR